MTISEAETPNHTETLLALAETKAYREEQLAAAFFIAAALAFNAGLPWLAWPMLAKAILDTLSAVAAWMAMFRARSALSRADTGEVDHGG